MSAELMISKVVAGALASGATAIASDTVLVDIVVALVGGFIAMTPREQGGSIQVWQGVAGVAMGVGLGFVLRSGELSDIVIRGAIFVASILSTLIVYWLRNPAQGLEAAKAFAGIIQKVLSALTGK